MTNNEKSIKDVIDSRLSELTVSQELEDKILNNGEIRRKSIRRPLAIAAAVLLCVMISIPVMAAKIESFKKLLYLISPQMAEFLQPVELVSEDQGIKMEVIAAMSDDETAVVYLTLNDLTDEGRVDETTDLYNYYIDGTHMFTHDLVDYDEDTKTATFSMIANGGDELRGKKLTLHLDAFLSGKEHLARIDPGIDLSSVAGKTLEIMSFDTTNFSGGGDDEFMKLMEKGSANILKADQEIINLPGVDFAVISGIGFVDGRLHVQTKWDGSIDNHGFLYLINQSGDYVNPGEIYFGVDKKGNPEHGKEYIEYIFKVGPEEISNYSLYGDFVKTNNHIEGKWQTTFQIEAIKEVDVDVRDLDLGGIKIDSMSMSPMGISFTGPGGITPDDLNIEITMDDGTPVSFGHMVSHEFNGVVDMKIMMSIPIEMDHISEVRINGVLVDIE